MVAVDLHELLGNVANFLGIQDSENEPKILPRITFRYFPRYMLASFIYLSVRSESDSYLKAMDSVMDCSTKFTVLKFSSYSLRLLQEQNNHFIVVIWDDLLSRLLDLIALLGCVLDACGG